ncbi:MAG: hypothetical protein DRP60_16620 [Spirochaetes bacterium]|nr:MAG: hypothetical protein DRP60_16620 [Spirochaetota bacterium]
MISIIDNKTINAALELRDKVDYALSLGISAESIGAALMMETGLDPGKISGPVPHSLDALLISANPA